MNTIDEIIKNTVKDTILSESFLDSVAQRMAEKIREQEKRASERLLTQKEVAKILRRSESTVGRMIKKGVLPSIVTPYGRRVRECDLLEVGE